MTKASPGNANDGEATQRELHSLGYVENKQGAEQGKTAAELKSLGYVDGVAPNAQNKTETELKSLGYK